MADRRDYYDDRDTFYTTGSGAPPRRGGGSEAGVYERFEEVRREEGSGRSRIQVRERERERDDDSRLPHFMRDERRGPSSAAPADTSGAMVLRQREIETVSRPRPRSPSQVRFEERTHYVRRRSPSPSVVSEPPRRERVEIRQFERRRSPSPHPSRGRSPSRERERIRIIERSRSRERIPSPSPSPPPPAPVVVPEVIRGPTIEREVITHYRNIDHGVIQAHPPPPPSPAPPRPILKTREVEVTRDTDIDITRTRGRSEVDVSIRRRSVSRDRGALVVAKRRSPSPETPARRTYDDLDRHKLRVDIDERHRSTSVTAEHTHHGHRRAHSAVPPSYRDEAERITSRIDARGRNGEAYGGATRDWTIVDVPPGTERGAGGGAADVTWERYSGVRRSRFVPERDNESSVSSNTTTVISERPRERERERVVETNNRVNVSVIDKNHEIEIEKTTRGRTPRRPKTDDMWTEITKDLVIREAIEDMGYDYEERGPFFYIMQYLQYDDVLQLVQLSDDIRRHRRRHLREMEYERESRQQRRSSKYDYDRELIVGVDREVVYDRPPVRGYLN
ncbi:hypothetical protein MAPG_02417 [Magnaporthiopsis poae ATCC 64411]|uniref:DUF8035 domain-containing protein n=1 Tax=Magnaporthiopsis poae (strain ATCC 64411 / 73-15) TaxID=644358 RepID=A0A0C4DRA9_MAGP6|nr:hypothetical protein MAPG_02417 [Magnaporthiopsis poae ATCC 64411]